MCPCQQRVHADSTLQCLGGGGLSSPLPMQSPAGAGGEDAQGDRSLSGVTGDRYCSYKGWG